MTEKKDSLEVVYTFLTEIEEFCKKNNIIIEKWDIKKPKEWPKIAARTYSKKLGVHLYIYDRSMNIYYKNGYSYVFEIEEYNSYHEMGKEFLKTLDYIQNTFIKGSLSDEMNAKLKASKKIAKIGKAISISLIIMVILTLVKCVAFN